MAFGSFCNDNDTNAMSEINVTPLVDVMLVLMIVFMVSMPVFTSSIKINLPTSSAKQPLDKGEIVRITVSPEGDYSIMDVPYTPEALSAELAKRAAENRDTVVAVHADRRVDYGHVVDVLETARLAGLSKVGFMTDPKPN